MKISTFTVGTLAAINLKEESAVAAILPGVCVGGDELLYQWIFFFFFFFFAAKPAKQFCSACVASFT